MAKTTKDNGKPSIFYSKNFGTMVTPNGSALFSSLIEPDAFRGADPSWKISLIFDPSDPEFVAFKAKAAEFAAEFAKDCGKKVDPERMFSVDKNSGNPMITFKSKVRTDENGVPVRIPIVDAQKVRIDREPWNGDIARVAFLFGGWDSAFGTGIKPYLNAVQLVERKPKGQTAFTSLDVFDSPAGIKADEIPF